MKKKVAGPPSPIQKAKKRGKRKEIFEKNGKREVKDGPSPLTIFLCVLNNFGDDEILKSITCVRPCQHLI